MPKRSVTRLGIPLSWTSVTMQAHFMPGVCIRPAGQDRFHRGLGTGGRDREHFRERRVGCGRLGGKVDVVEGHITLYCHGRRLVGPVGRHDPARGEGEHPGDEQDHE
jgi:hypothetical protein